MSDNGFLETVSSEYDDNEQKMVLYIETLTGTAFEMIVSPMDSILSIKNKIHHDEGIPISQQHLLLGEKELNNTSYLKEEGITRGCTLKLVLGMRGGPISTRRASSRSEHLIWREIKDFVETTKDDMMAKVPAGCKITFLIYREGDTINLLKVVENNDGSYSSLSDLRKSTSSVRSRMNVRTDSEVQQHTMDNKQNITLTKMAELRHKMEELNIKKYKKLHKTNHNVVDNIASNDIDKKKNKLESVFDPKSKTDKTMTKVKRYSMNNEIGKMSSSKSKVKQWLNSDYYDHSSFISRKSKTATYQQDVVYGSSHHLKGNVLKLQPVYTDSSDDEDTNFNKNYKIKSSESFKRILFPNRKDIVEPSSSNCDDHDLLEDDDNESNLAISNKTTTDLLAEYYPKISRTELRQTLESRRKSFIDDSNVTPEEDISLGDRNCTTTTVHEASSIAILEEDSETNVVVNDESEFNPPPVGPISVPSPDASTFTISQIPRERVSTPSGTGSARNRIRVARFVLKNDQRPKTSPDKISREFCEFLLNDLSDDLNSTKCYETDEPPQQTKGNKLRFKRTKYISASSSKLDKINNNLKSLSSTNTVYSWPRVSSSNKTSGGLTCCSGGHHISNRFKLTKFENVYENKEGLVKTTTLSGIQNKGFLENIESSSNSSQQNDKEDEVNQMKKENENELVHLPPIKQKKSTRVRCKKCSKKLNIATIHTCRCGDHFCSQHRYSEVHGCKYDYKTEGRKEIEQANPLIRAPKLPKI